MTLESSIPSIRLMSLGLATLGLALVAAFAFALFALPARVPAAVLYDQMSGTPGGLVASEQSIVANTNDCLKPLFTPIDAQDCIAADDFTVPPGSAWNVTVIETEGQGGAGANFKFELFKDAGGLPFSPSSAGLGTGERRGPKSGSGRIVFRSKEWSRGHAALPPGAYWLAVYADGLENEESAASWYWRSQSPQVGREAVWGLMCGATSEPWSYLSACGQTGPDLRFRLKGERMTRRFSRFQLGKPTRKQNGGLRILGAFPGPGELVVAGVGKGAKRTIEARKRPVVEDAPVPIQINPTSQTKKALKEGARLRARVAISFERAAGIRRQGPAFTRTLTVLLDKP